MGLGSCTGMLCVMSQVPFLAAPAQEGGGGWRGLKGSVFHKLVSCVVRVIESFG